MSDLFILDARNVFKTLFEYRRAVLLKNHRKKSRKRRCYLVLLFLTDVKVTSFLGASLSLGRLSSSPATRCPPLPTHQSSGSHDGCQRDNSCFTTRRVFSVGFRGPCLLCAFSKPRVLPYSIQSIRCLLDFVNSDALQSSRVSRHGQDVR